MTQSTCPDRSIDPRVVQLSKDPELIKTLIHSLAPNLNDLENVKLATLYHLVKGSNDAGVNILLIGDPGTGKTHLLQCLSKILNVEIRDHEAIDSTASQFLLENIGRLPSGDQRLLESLIKVGSQVSVYAACRPFLGRYNPYQTVIRNIHLPVGLLSLFDLVFILRDHPDPDKDHLIALKILGDDARVDSIIDNEFFVEYLNAARELNPVLSDEAKTVLHDYYIALRTHSSEEDAIAITPWQLVTLKKISEARAKLHLREQVSAEDAEAAIRMVDFCLEQVGIDPVRRNYDIDAYYTGRPNVLNSKLLHVAEAFMELEKVSTPVKRIDIESSLWEKYGMTRRTVGYLLRTLVEEGFIVEDSGGCYKRREWGCDEL